MFEQEKILEIAERSINHYLSFDPEKAAEFESLEGKCIKVVLSAPAITAYCLPMAGEIQIDSEYTREPDVSLTTTLGGLIKLSQSDNPTEAIKSGDIEIDGDLRLAQKFSDILSGIDFDWEQRLSQYSGDLIANRLGGLFRSGQSWLKQTRTNLRMDTAEYLTEEADILPTKIEVESFSNKVENLRDAVDRLEARINLLDAKKNK